jgi:succinate dehydrogenase/fumarate reductase cytochrome b subunit
MPFFPLISLQDMALAFFLGLVTFILLYVAWASYPPGDLNKPEVRELQEVPEAADNPLPPFLVFVYVGVAVWALAYFILIGLRVKAIG